MSIGQIDRKAFFAGYRTAFKDRLSPAHVSGLDFLLGALEDDDAILDVRHAAYMLATVKHETADTYEPIEEYGKGRGHPYGKVVTLKDADGQTVRVAHYGRGYVQLTWDRNYTLFGKRLGLDLRAHPELALERDTAYRIMSEGMRLGLFTGKKLSDYLNATRSDNVNARRIINGTDRAALIAGYAEKFDDLLTDTISNPVASSEATVVEAVNVTPAASTDNQAMVESAQTVVQTGTLPAQPVEAVAGGGAGEAAVTANTQTLWSKLTVWATASGVGIGTVTTVIEKVTGLSPTVQLVLIGGVVVAALLAGLFIGLRHLFIMYAHSRPDMINVR